MTPPSDLRAQDRTQHHLPTAWHALGAIVAPWLRSPGRRLFRPPRIMKSAPAVTVGFREATGGGSASGDGITANGYVVARTKASVSKARSGRFRGIGVTEGSRVKTGDVIGSASRIAEHAAAGRERAGEREPVRGPARAGEGELKCFAVAARGQTSRPSPRSRPRRRASKCSRRSSPARAAQARTRRGNPPTRASSRRSRAPCCGRRGRRDRNAVVRRRRAHAHWRS